MYKKQSGHWEGELQKLTIEFKVITFKAEKRKNKKDLLK
jgi:hypothetical protein